MSTKPTTAPTHNAGVTKQPVRYNVDTKVLDVRGIPEYADFLLALSEQQQMTRPALFYQILQWYAETTGYQAPPPRSYPNPCPGVGVYHQMRAKLKQAVTNSSVDPTGVPAGG